VELKMSNELSVILQSNPSLVGTGLDEDTLAVAGGGAVASGNKRISIAGGVFRKMANGKEVGTIEDRHMNIIFVKMAHDPSRAFYAEAYKEGEKVSPTCWSSDAKKPDADVKSPCASSCDQCDNSAKGSGNGGTGTSCRLSWRTAVVLPNDPSGDVMQLVIPATSAFGKEDNGRWPFKAYINMLAQNNVSAGRVVTKMQFDTKTKYAKVLFSAAAAVDESDYEVIKAQGKSAVAENAVRLTVFKQDGGVSEAPALASPEATEPVKRESTTKPTEKADGDVADIVKKWSKKA
jgi:hypothetical protein